MKQPQRGGIARVVRALRQSDPNFLSFNCYRSRSTREGGGARQTNSSLRVKLKVPNHLIRTFQSLTCAPAEANCSLFLPVLFSKSCSGPRDHVPGTVGVLVRWSRPSIVCGVFPARTCGLETDLPCPAYFHERTDAVLTRDSQTRAVRCVRRGASRGTDMNTCMSRSDMKGKHRGTGKSN